MACMIGFILVRILLCVYTTFLAFRLSAHCTRLLLSLSRHQISLLMERFARYNVGVIVLSFPFFDWSYR